jgi:hypothetical protein
MIRWFCSFFLEEHLPVAGVLQHADGSSRQPPAAAFQPLHVLLQQVQQGGAYMPHNAMPAGRASASQLLLAMPASPPPRHVMRAQQQQQQQQQHDLKDSLADLPRCKAGLPVVDEGVVSLEADGAEPALPISTLSSEPAATPTGRHAENSSAGGSWGSAGGLDPPQQQQQQNEVLVNEPSSSGNADASSVQQQMAARLRDAARLEASPMRSAVASPVVGHSNNSGNAGRLAPGSLSFDAHAGSSKLSSKVATSNSSSAVEGASRSSGGGWGIQAVQDALGSVGSAVEGLAMQVAEGLDSLDSMANAAAGPEAGDLEGGNVAAEGSNSALDFVSDFPQLFPAAVMSNVVQQRHSAAGVAAQQHQRDAAGGASSKELAASSMSNVLAEQQQQQPSLTAAASGAVADMSEFAAEAVRQVRSVVAAAQLPGVWRVESLHQMLRAVSPEPASRAAAAAGTSKR